MNANLPLTSAKSTHTPKLTQEYLKSILSYDPETGVFTWKERQDVERPAQWNSRYAGEEAGCEYKNGNTFYRCIGINFKYHAAHRLAWLYVMGDWPA